MTENSVCRGARLQTASALMKFAGALRALLHARAFRDQPPRRDADRLSDHLQRDIGLSRDRS